MAQLVKFEYSLTEEELLSILDMASYGSNYWADEINYNLDESMFIEVWEVDKKYSITKNQIEQSIVAIAENRVEIQLHPTNRKKVYDYMTRDMWDTDACSSSLDYIL